MYFYVSHHIFQTLGGVENVRSLLRLYIPKTSKLYGSWRHRNEELSERELKYIFPDRDVEHDHTKRRRCTIQ